MTRQFRPLAILVAAAILVAVVIVFLRREPPELADAQLTIRPGLSTLAVEPDWTELEAYDGTIPRDVFIDQLQDIYSEGDAWRSVVEVFDTHADIRAGGSDRLRIQFAKTEPPGPPKRYWRASAELPAANDLAKLPLQGLRIAIDPGHIGGSWARMEERWYQIGGEGVAVQEGDLTLQTARALKPKLEALGAEVHLVRDALEPVTKMRPEDFAELATQLMASEGGSGTQGEIRKLSEKLFYRTHEIRRRAQVVNDDIKPDLAICLHYNAESWGDPNSPQLVPRNHFHLLINGTYSRAEFRLNDNRFHLFKRLLQRTHDEELALNQSIAEAMVEETGLSRYIYITPNAKPVGRSGYIYARNLLANRIYHCPVVFLEPYVMNSRDVYQRVKAGDYEGKQEVAGKLRKSLVREYADGLTEGLRRYYVKARSI